MNQLRALISGALVVVLRLAELANNREVMGSTPATGEPAISKCLGVSAPRNRILKKLLL